MNPSPRKHGQDIPAYTNHVDSWHNMARYFWQSRMTRAGAPAPLPPLTNIPQLAKDIRRAHATAAYAGCVHHSPAACIATWAGRDAGFTAVATDPYSEAAVAARESYFGGVDRSTVATARRERRRIHTRLPD